MSVRRHATSTARGLGALAVCLFASTVGAQPAPVEPDADGPVEVLKVQGNVWLIGNAGGNVVVQAGDQGVVVVDTGAVGLSDAVMAAIRGISTRPIRYIVNTSLGPQHVGGNAVLAALPGGSTRGATRGVTPSVIAQENVFARMTRPGADGAAPFPSAAWPTDGYYAPRRGLVFNGEAIDIIHLPNAHSDGDSAVYFRGSNVLVTGDVFTTTSLPLVNRAQGGTYAGLLSALNALLDIAVPDDLMEGGTYIVPGHGRICDEADLVEYRDMAYQIRDRLEKLAAGGKTLAEAKAARPVLGWEGRYSRSGWTTDLFLDAVYDEFARSPRTAASTPAPPPGPAR